MESVTEEERKRRIEAIKKSARETDRRIAEGRIRRRLVLEQFDRAIDRLIRAAR